MPGHEPRSAASARPYSPLGPAVVAIALLLVVVLGGCGSERDDVGRATFERGLVESEDITVEQADCVAGYVFDAYDAAEIRLIHDDGLQALPSPRWAEYAHAMIGCLFHAELTGTAP